MAAPPSASASWFTFTAKGDDRADISIHDEIGYGEGSGRLFLDRLKGLGKNASVHLSIHSPGGSVLDGWAIFNALEQHEGRITARVTGFAGSMASVILMAADEIEIPENGWIMIHNPTAGVWGEASEMVDMAATLEKIQGGIVKAYAKRTGIEEGEVADLMAHTTFMDGAEAVERGFADTLLEPVKAVALADEWREKLPKNTLPDGLVFGSQPTPPEPKPEPQGQTGPKPEATASNPPISTPTPIAMSNPAPSVDPGAEINIKDLLAQDKPRRDDIKAIGAKFKLPEAKIDHAIENGVTVADFRASVLEDFDPQAFTPKVDAKQLSGAAKVGDASAKGYSLFKAISEATKGGGETGALTGLEREVQDELEKKYQNATGESAKGILIPAEFWNFGPQIKNAATVGTGTSGGNTVETEMQGLTDYLKDYSILPRLGVTVFRDAQGNLTFPRSTAGYSGTWDAETDTISNADATFAANLTLTPKRVGAGTAVSKMLLAQSSVDFEAWVRSELQYAIATAVDRAAIKGGGGDAPTGVLSASGTDAYAWQSGSAAWTNIVAQIKDYRDNKAPLERAQWLADLNTWESWMGTQIAASTGRFIIDQNPRDGAYTVAGRPFHEHSDVTADKVILADWSRLFVAMWGGIMLTVDPYSKKTSGQVELYAETFADCGVLQPNSFVIGDDGTAHNGALS